MSGGEMSNLREAAQQALEALKDYKCSDDDRVSIAMHILSTALEQAEPVVWMCPDDPERETAFHWQAGHCDNCGKQRVPLYAAPPQRKPLTDEEIEKLFGGAVADVPRAHWLRQAAIEVVRKTERAHGIGEEE